jgi:hypothetical protein
MIPKVIFKFDKEKDLWNIWDTCNAKAQYGGNWTKSVTSNIYQMCHKKSLAQCKKELAKTMKHIHDNRITSITARLFNEAWKEIAEEYFKRLEKIMKSPFCSKKVTAYLTTAGRFPYNPNKKNPSFYVGFFGSPASILHTAGHELMHIQFHNSKYWKICEKEIGRKETMDLKEALTVLLNWEFHDLWIIQDNGYPNHVELRKSISLQWEKEKDFDKLIDNSIIWIKKNGIK